MRRALRGGWCFAPFADNDALAERSKAVAQGAIPKGRGFEPHRRHFGTVTILHQLGEGDAARRHCKFMSTVAC